MNIGRRLRRLATPLFRRNKSLATAYIYLRGLKSILAKPRPSSHGFMLVGNNDMLEGTYEPHETKTIERLLKDVDSFINIGANTGYYCAIAISQGVETIAFEPLPQNLAMLYATISANNWQNKIEVFPIALGSQTGLSDIYGYGTGASLVRETNNPEYLSMLVPINRLDKIIGHRMEGKNTLVLMDAEGAEYEILSAAGPLLSQTPRPTWIIEIGINYQYERTKAEERFLDTFRIMWDHGYSATAITSEAKPVNEKILLELLAAKEPNIPHNYLFTPDPVAGS